MQHFLVLLTFGFDSAFLFYSLLSTLILLPHDIISLLRYIIYDDPKCCLIMCQADHDI